MPARGGRRPSGRLRKVLYTPDLTAAPPAELTEVLDRHLGRRDATIAALQQIQALYGHLPDHALKHASRRLQTPLARFFGAATFYNQFRFDPPGRIELRVCCGTACHVGGAPGVLEALKTHLQIEEAQTTADGMFTLQTVYCVGGCSVAPVVLAGGAAQGRLTPGDVPTLLERLRAEAGDS
jgi:NADH-quinone oxidoreductase subunit E